MRVPPPAGAAANSRRDEDLEHRFLAAVTGHAHAACDDFTRRVCERLDRAGMLFGRDIPDHLTVAEILGEVREEAEDVAGWSIMALHVARDHGLSDIAAHRLRRRLGRAAAFAAMLDREIAEALGELGTS